MTGSLKLIPKCTCGIPEEMDFSQNQQWIARLRPSPSQAKLFPSLLRLTVN